MNLEKLIKEKIAELSPEERNIKIPEQMFTNITKIQAFIDNDNQIYKNREKYDLQWAFKNAQNNINNFFDVLLNRTKPYFINFKQKNPKVLSELKKSINLRRKKSLKRKLNSYSIAFFSMSFIDIVISIILILIITKVGYISESLFSSAIFGILFFVIVILLKVSLDRFYIIPRVHSWGWKKFKTINDRFAINISILLAFLIIANKLTKEGNTIQIKYLLKNVKLLIK